MKSENEIIDALCMFKPVKMSSFLCLLLLMLIGKIL